MYTQQRPDWPAETETRTCRKCGFTGPIAQFIFKGTTPSGKPHILYKCVPCLNKRQKELREADPERHREYSRTNGVRNREKINARSAAYRKAHPEQVLIGPRAWRKANPDRARAGTKRWIDARPGYRERYNQQYRERRRDALNAYDRERYRDPKRKETTRECGARRRARVSGSRIVEKIRWSHIIKRDKSTCYLCDRVLAKEEITFDHVVPLSRGGAHTEENLRVACRSCNGRKSAMTIEEYFLRYPKL